MTIYVFEGKGVYLGAVYVVMSLTKQTARTHLKAWCDKYHLDVRTFGLTDEIPVTRKIFTEVYSWNGDY